QSKSIIFDNKACLVKDPATNSTLDLSKFEIVERKFESATGNISMSFNLCGKLAGGCGTELNSSACLSIGKKDFVLGLEGEYGFQAD
uniref:Uncharacterized protein n=1 Tax=Megaselia scalaris TaxID=36166 RepID=T1GVS7_MEGSC